MNRLEYGVWFWMSVGFDISGFTALTIEFTKPDGTALVVTNPDVEVGAMDVNTVWGLFPANKYFAYRFQNGDVDQAGVWSVRSTYLDGSQYLISDVATFTINE